MDDLSQFFGEAGFDTATVPPMDDVIPIPPGKYTCLIEKAEIKKTKTGTGHGLAVSFSVVEGNHTGRKVFDFINIENLNNVCQEIGRRVLSALVQGVGLQRLGPVAELVNKVVVAHVKVKGDRNDVRTYSAPVAAPAPPFVPGSYPVGPVVPVAAPMVPVAAPTHVPTVGPVQPDPGPAYVQPMAPAPVYQPLRTVGPALGTYPAAPTVAPAPAPAVLPPQQDKPWG